MTDLALSFKRGSWQDPRLPLTVQGQSRPAFVASANEQRYAAEILYYTDAYDESRLIFLKVSTLYTDLQRKLALLGIVPSFALLAPSWPVFQKICGKVARFARR